MKRASLFNLPVDIGLERSDIIQRMAAGKMLLSYLNPYSFTVIKTDPEYPSKLQQFDFVVCDGIGIQTAVAAVFKMTTPIISLDFYGMGKDYLSFAAERSMDLCLVGAEPGVAAAAAVSIGDQFPGMGSISSFNGFGNSPARAKQFILESNPSMVLAGLGMGKQESFLLDITASGWNGIGICVGGFFDKLANPQLKYPRWTERTNLRFLGRLIKEPRRMSKRYFIDYLPFIKKYIGHLFGLK
jgi:N-acetylglucosaminyldiphosphoundecaprenol N-acetyl-beta-D-mannosaminyltransferase